MLQFSNEVTESPVKIQGKDRQKNPPLNIVRTGFRDILKHPAM